MKINLKVILVLLAAAVIIYSCKKNETEFRDFLGDKEVVYPGSVSAVVVQPGDGRAGLKWKASSDPTITKYVIYWNNKADSITVDIDPAAAGDSIRAIIPGLSEYTYAFTIHSYDKKGNKSVPRVVNNVKVYGDIYKSTLLNRGYDAVAPFVYNDDGSVKLNFITTDTANNKTTINTKTVILYTNLSDQEKEVDLPWNENSALLANYKPGSTIKYKSYYKPDTNAIDEFQVNEFSDYPQIFRLVPCDKGLFRQTNNPNDVYADFGTGINKLWDGSTTPQGYPNIFHSNERQLPQQLTIDLGKEYNNLSHFEETGRDCCHNPDQFEVWGIADINGHDTTLPPGNAGWKDEAIAKGWVLLKDVVRTDDGRVPFKFEIDNHGAKIRYIRLRIKHNSNGENYYSNMSELTVWNKE